MEDNPFSAMVAMVRNMSRDQVPASYRFGTVIYRITDPKPIKILVAEQELELELFLRSNSVGTITSQNAGDTLLLVPIEDEQRYIILCKVVSA